MLSNSATGQAPLSGFTLVEVITVLAITALMATSVLGTLSRSREQAYQSTCQSNLKELALAIHQYIQDQDGRFPPAGYVVSTNSTLSGQLAWPDAIEPYVKCDDVFLCPEQTVSSVNLDYAFDIERLDERLAPAPLSSFTGQLESKLANTANLWLNADSRNGSVLIDVNACGWCPIRPGLHDGGANYSFVDGHVKWMTPSTATRLEMQIGPPQ